jgi:hypothetical protein
MTHYFWTGVGSRETPEAVLQTMTNIAKGLSKGPYIFRSGAADGADQAFEKGCNPLKKEIYLPSKNFKGHPSSKYNIQCEKAIEWARRAHPYFDKMDPSGFAYKAHVRNAHQVLGERCDQPSSFVVCWTPDGAENEYDSVDIDITGGTRTAIVIADLNGIPVFNLARPDALQRLMVFVREQRLLERLEWYPDQAFLAETKRKKLESRKRTKLRSRIVPNIACIDM